MFELFSVINIVVAAFMIGNDYDQIAEYQSNKPQVEDTVMIVEDDGYDGVTDLDS